MNPFTLSLVAVAALVLAVVALSVAVCEWRARKRRAKEALAVYEAMQDMHLREQEKMDRFVQSMSPEQREKWERTRQALSLSLASNASPPNQGQTPRDAGEQVPRLHIG